MSQILHEGDIQKLKHLSFEGNEMGDESLRVLTLGVKECYALKSLNLSKNNITDVSAFYLASIIEIN